jgi:hypothetical protein
MTLFLGMRPGRIVFTLNGFGFEYAIFSVIGGEEMKLAIGKEK